MEEISCDKLLEIAKDEWKAFVEYSRMPEPFQSFALDELKHFSQTALIIREKCPVKYKEIESLVATRG